MIAVTTCAFALTGAQAAHASPSASDLKKQIAAEQKQVSAVAESYDALKIQLTKTTSDLTKLQASLAPAKAALASATAQVGAIATTSYEQGRAGPATALLSSGSDDLMAKLGFLDQIQTSNQRDIDTYTTATQTFTQRQAALTSTKQKQAAQLQGLADRKAKYNDQIKKLKTQLAQSQSTDSTVVGGSVAYAAGAAGEAVAYAKGAIGAGYSLGASGPDLYDCSGLTMMAWKAAGVSLPHNAAAQWGVVAHISKSSLKAGDLVFYDNLGHVAIYVGDDHVIDAPTYGKLVAIRSIDRGMPIYGYGRPS